MRKACLQMVHELARSDQRVVFIGSDLGAGTLTEMRQEFPERYLMEGVSEANILGMAAGLALEGKVPYVNTIATFLTRRVMEQVALDLCLHNASVRLIGNGGGMVYAPLGPTHMATDDLALLRPMPNMTILAPADAREMRRLMPLTVDHPGPIYIRLAKGYDAVVTPKDYPYRIGEAVPLRRGRQLLLVTTGVTAQLALAAAELLAPRGLEATVLHMPTVKPLDREALLEAAAPAEVVLSVEEHVVTGGLGSAVAEVLAEAHPGGRFRFRRLGIPDVFPDQYGSQASLMRRYGITTEGIIEAALELSELQKAAP